MKIENGKKENGEKENGGKKIRKFSFFCLIGVKSKKKENAIILNDNLKNMKRYVATIVQAQLITTRDIPMSCLDKFNLCWLTLNNHMNISFENKTLCVTTHPGL